MNDDRDASLKKLFDHLEELVVSVESLGGLGLHEELELVDHLLKSLDASA
jgi:hypothetical protein